MTDDGYQSLSSAEPTQTRRTSEPRYSRVNQGDCDGMDNPQMSLHLLTFQPEVGKDHV